MSTTPPGAPGGPGGDPAAPHTSEQPTCPRHPDRVSYVRCQRCGRPTCPECQRPAAVGIQCVDCVKEGSRSAPTPRTRFGAPVSTGTPYVTFTLIGLCVAVYLGQRTVPGLTRELAFVGVLGGSEPWRYITSAFVHSPTSLLHILFNMYILWAFGPVLERSLGWVKFLVTYLLCAVGGSVGVLLLAPPDPGWLIQVVGASGAIFGLLFLYVVLVLRQGQVPTSLLLMIGINLALPFLVGGIAWQAHLGGLLVGAACAAVIAYTGRRRGEGPTATANFGVHWVGLAAITALLVVLAVAKYAVTTSLL